MTPHPIYTFLVNNIDYQEIYSQPLPSDIDNVIMGLNNQSVCVPYLNRPLNNGDIFTLYGKRAQIVRDMFIGKLPRVLELVASTDVLPTLITNKFEMDQRTIPIKNFSSSHQKAIVINYSGAPCSFLVNIFDASGNSINATLYKDGVVDSDSPSSSFLVEIENRNYTEIVMSSESNFCFAYTELAFN